MSKRQCRVYEVWNRLRTEVPLRSSCRCNASLFAKVLKVLTLFNKRGVPLGFRSSESERLASSSKKFSRSKKKKVAALHRRHVLEPSKQQTPIINSSSKPFIAHNLIQQFGVRRASLVSYCSPYLRHRRRSGDFRHTHLKSRLLNHFN